MEQYGNTTTFNLEPVLVQNILRSQFWEKRAKSIADWGELVDEIYDNVDNVEPWMSGNARGPSTAFNLLYRLGQLKPDARQVRQMLDHRDSPYIRAIGFLYLRYVCDPRKLWDWFKHYMADDEEFEPSPQGLGNAVTMGEFARDIMLDQFFFETIFPRVPKPAHDDICAHLREMGLPSSAKGNAGQGGPDRRGVTEGTARPASVKASLSVAFGQRAPNRAGAREQGRGMGSELQEKRRDEQDDRRSREDRRNRDDVQNRDDRRDSHWSNRRRDERQRSRSRSRSRDRFRSTNQSRSREGRDREGRHTERDWRDQRHRRRSRSRER